MLGEKVWRVRPYLHTCRAVSYPLSASCPPTSYNVQDWVGHRAFVFSQIRGIGHRPFLFRSVGSDTDRFYSNPWGRTQSVCIQIRGVGHRPFLFRSVGSDTDRFYSDPWG